MIPQIVGEAGIETTAPLSSDSEVPAAAYQDSLLARDHFNRLTESAIASAYEQLKTLVRDHPDYAEAQALYAHVTLMNSARMEGDIPWIIAEEQVRRTLQKASALKPDLPEIYLVEGLLHARSRDPQAAIGFFEKAIELNPSYAEAYLHLSEAAMDLGRSAEAWEALETARKLDPISVSTLTRVVREAEEHGRPEMADDAMRALQQVAPASADYLQLHRLFENYRIAEAAIALEDFRANWPDEDPHDWHLARCYAILGKTNEAMALHPAVKAYVAAELGQREFALSAMEEEAASRTDPHDRADLYWVTYVNLDMRAEALEVLSDLWYGYAAEDIGPRMDVGDAFTLIVLLRDAGRADEAAPIAEQLLAISSSYGEDWMPFNRMVEGNYEAALHLFIERTRNGRPLIGYTGVRKGYFVLEDFPEYATLERLTNDWIEEQRALYDELTAARASAEDTAHP